MSFPGLRPHLLLLDQGMPADAAPLFRRLGYQCWQVSHFHVRYAGQKALIAIETLAVLRGSLSPRALALVTEWATLHQAELMEDWALARGEAQLNPIAPLE